MQILLNNNFVKQEEAQISIFSDAVMYGLGVFETLRTYQGKTIFRLEDHVSRLINSASHIGLELIYSFEEIQQMVLQIVEKSEFELQRIKILAISDNLIVISNELELDEKTYNGVSLKSVIHMRIMPEIKSTSYMDCIIHHRRAIQLGYYDALFVDAQNNVYECTRSNIFWIKSGKLYTKKQNVLAGIMREFVIDISHLPVEFYDGNLSDLLEADEVFITNSIIGIVPVIKINDSYISLGQVGNDTLEIAHQLDNTIKQH